MHIAAAGNVEVPAYLVLKYKGFNVTCEGDVWRAEKGNQAFTGDGPLELLGLVGMYEARGESWRASDAEIAAFLDEFPQSLEY